MKFKLLDESAEKTFALIFEKGDEVMAELKRFANEQHLLASHFTAIGALNDVLPAVFQTACAVYPAIRDIVQVQVPFGAEEHG